MNIKSFIDSQLDKSKCFIWPNSSDKDGYRRIKYMGKSTKAHRVAFSLYNKEPIEGKFVLHKCDNRACCNPDHLFLGDAKSNYDDAKRKGRHTHGEMMGTAKVTEDLVKKIRAENLTQVEIAKKYNISQSSVSYIRRREHWSHVN